MANKNRYSADFKELVFREYLALSSPRKLVDLTVRLVEKYGQSPVTTHLSKWRTEGNWDNRCRDAHVMANIRGNGNKQLDSVKIPQAWEAGKELRDTAYILLKRVQEWAQTANSPFIADAMGAKAMSDVANNFLEASRKMERSTEDLQAGDELETLENIRRAANSLADDAMAKLAKQKMERRQQREEAKETSRAAAAAPVAANDARRGDRVLQGLGIN